MEIETGQVWKFKNIKRSNVEIVRYDKFSEIVYIKYADSKSEFDMPLKMFVKDFEKIK